MDPREIEAASDDVYGVLLEGRPPSGAAAAGGGGGGVHANAATAATAAATTATARANGGVSVSAGSGVAPSLLTALGAASMLSGHGAALAQLVPERYAVLTPRDFLDASFGMRPPAETSKGPAGLFEPLAVLLVHNVLLAGAHSLFTPPAQLKARL